MNRQNTNERATTRMNPILIGTKYTAWILRVHGSDASQARIDMPLLHFELNVCILVCDVQCCAVLSLQSAPKKCFNGMLLQCTKQCLKWCIPHLLISIHPCIWCMLICAVCIYESHLRTHLFICMDVDVDVDENGNERKRFLNIQKPNRTQMPLKQPICTLFNIRNKY